MTDWFWAANHLHHPDADCDVTRSAATRQPAQDGQALCPTCVKHALSTEGR